MNHEKMREQVHAGIDRQCASLTSDPYRVQRVLNAAKPEGGQIVVRKVPRFVIVMLIVLALSVSTALAAGIISWHRGLEDMLRVNDETKEYYQALELFDEPGLSVTQGDVTVTLEQSIVDTNAAYFAFRVKGYQPPKGKQPTFASTDIAVENKEFRPHYNASFFDGLVVNSEGTAVYLDGSVPEDYSAVPYTDENGELVYIIRMYSDTPDMLGQHMTITFTDLGVYTDKWGTHEAQATGTWAFEFELAGTEHSWTFGGLNLKIGDSGSKITRVRLSPIHIQMTMEVAPSLREYETHEDGDSIIPFFYGVKMKNGTRYELITEAGTTGYTSPDQEGHEYQMLFTLNRIIEPANVDAFLFSYPDADGERQIVEVPLNKLH